MRNNNNWSFVICHCLSVVGLLLMLSGTAQATAVSYTNSYQPSVASYQLSAVGYQGATAPSATFQSTSAYADQWNQDTQQSMLNADGSMNTGAYMTSGPRRAPGGAPGGPGTPGGTLDPTTQQPLGDGLWALMLCATAYIVLRRTRCERDANEIDN